MNTTIQETEIPHFAKEAITRNSCPFCSAVQRRILYPGTKPHVVQCNSCGLVYSRFIPTLIQLQEHYGSYPEYAPLSELTIIRYNEILDRLESYRRNNKLLETGCGYGFFLEEARKRNWEIAGTEYSGTAIQKCVAKGIRIIDESEIKSADNLGQYDVIISIEVIEHLADIDYYISLYQQLLRPGGVIYLTTPNFNSITRRIWGSKWGMIHYPEHLTYFSPKSIRDFFHKHGFGLVNLKTTGISPGRLLRSNKEDNPNQDNSKFKDADFYGDQKLRESMQQKPWLKVSISFINQLLTIFKCGDTIKALFEKRK